MIRFEEKENERNYIQIYDPYTGDFVEGDTLSNKQVDFNFYDDDVPHWIHAVF